MLPLRNRQHLIDLFESVIECTQNYVQMYRTALYSENPYNPLVFIYMEHVNSQFRIFRALMDTDREFCLTCVGFKITNYTVAGKYMDSTMPAFEIEESMCMDELLDNLSLLVDLIREQLPPNADPDVCYKVENLIADRLN